MISRHISVFKAHLGGKTYREIADNLGISIQRAAQLSDAGRLKLQCAFARVDEVDWFAPPRHRWLQPRRREISPHDSEVLRELDLEFEPGDVLPKVLRSKGET